MPPPNVLRTKPEKLLELGKCLLFGHRIRDPDRQHDVVAAARQPRHVLAKPGHASRLLVQLAQNA
ncbi:MAG: hypothetical protein JO318_14760 [Chloroflexi bacterium]|nr:hypothetical protein [Chloroflexota bacterium]